MKKKPVNKETKAYKTKELRKLRNKCLKLWSLAVRARAGNKCEWCWVSSDNVGLNAHHIEGYMTNHNLRFDVRNGLCLCPKHHKFSFESAHRSFCFTLKLMGGKRRDDLKFLMANWNKPQKEVTKEFYLSKIKELEEVIKQCVR